MLGLLARVIIGAVVAGAAGTAGYAVYKLLTRDKVKEEINEKLVRNFDDKMEYLGGIVTVDILNKWFKEQPESMAAGVTKVYAIPTADIMKSFGYHCEEEIDPDKNLLQFFYDEKTKDILGLRIVRFDNIDSTFQSILMERNGIIKFKKEK